MSELRKHLGRMFLFVFFFVAPAFAQFEIAPDHFPDSDELAAQPAPKHATKRDQRVAKQQAILAECRAQIKAKTDQVAAASQAFQLATSAGQIEAVLTQRRELQKRLNSLASAVRGAERTTALLQRELAVMAPPSTRRPAKHRD